MGWEWRDRPRDRLGRWQALPEQPRKERMNLKLDADTANWVRRWATWRRMEYSQFVNEVLNEYFDAHRDEEQLW